MTALLAFALVLTAAPKPAASDLAAYLAALEDLVVRRKQIVELVAAGQISDARREADRAPVPPVLGTDWKLLQTDLPHPPEAYSTGRPPRVAAAHFAFKMGFPEIAGPLFGQAIRHGEKVAEETLDSVRRDLVAVGSNQEAAESESQHSRTRARELIALWKRRNTVVDGDFLDVLAKLLPRDGSALALAARADFPGLSSAQRLQRLREGAQRAGPQHELKAWRRLAEARITPFATAEAMLKWGTLELARGDAAAAIPLLEQARDLDPDFRGSHAQWALGHAHFATGNPASALQAWKRDEEEFLTHPCLREDAERKHRLWQGLALERLGRVDEALPHYAAVLGHPLVAAHVLDLYEAAGQFEDAQRLFAAMEFRYPEQYAAAVPGLSMVVLRRMARAKEWPSLAAAAFREHFDIGDYLGLDRVKRAIPAEAMRLLARDCAASVPLVAAAMAAAHPQHRLAHVRALAGCDAPAAVQVLVAEVEGQGPNTYSRGAALDALSATRLGREALTARGWVAPGHRYPRDPEAGWREPVPEFPKPEGGPLPARIAPQAPRPARHDPERRLRLSERRDVGMGCVPN